MKKITLVLMLIGLICNAQTFELTTTGLKDSGNINNSYVVIEASGKTATDIYNALIKDINVNYKNPDEVIKGNIANEYLKYDTYIQNFMKVNNSGAKIPVDARYTTEINIKDNKVKYELVTIDVGIGDWQGSVWKGYPIWNTKGKLRLPETKDFIENHFNNDIKRISELLNNETDKDEW